MIEVPAAAFKPEPYDSRVPVATKPVIALDADGVLLDLSLGYASVWERAFGVRPAERDPKAYWPFDRWEVERLEDEATTAAPIDVAGAVP